MQHQSQQASTRSAQTDFTGRFVFPYDAEDLKAHRWFKGVPWERLHELDPPFVPMIRSPDDTQYFNDEEPITELSDSDNDDEDQGLPEPETSASIINLNAGIDRDGANDNATMITMTCDPASSSASMLNHTQQSMPPSAKPPVRGEIPSSYNTPKVGPVAASPAATSNKKRIERDVQLAEVLDGFDRSIQQAVHSWLAVPYDSIRLRNFELQVDAETGLRASERDALKALARMYGRKEKKRPRDKLLRDPLTKKAVLEERRRSAFLGYD